MPDVRMIRVFIASPGDLAVERPAFKQVLEELNAGFGDALDIQFEPLGWEDTLASTGRRLQEVINREIDRCDVFLLAMHRRWGQAAPDAQPYSSYTEEEFHRAALAARGPRRGAEGEGTSLPFRFLKDENGRVLLDRMQDKRRKKP